MFPTTWRLALLQEPDGGWSASAGLAGVLAAADDEDDDVLAQDVDTLLESIPVKLLELAGVKSRAVLAVEAAVMAQEAAAAAAADAEEAAAVAAAAAALGRQSGSQRPSQAGAERPRSRGGGSRQGLTIVPFSAQLDVKVSGGDFGTNQLKLK